MSVPDVVYVHPSKHPLGLAPQIGAPRSPYMTMPVGVTALGNLLQENGHSVVGLNYPLEVLLNRGFSLEGELSSLSGAYLVMIDLHWYEHAYGAIDVARVARRALPQAKIALGGLTASAFAREILKSFREVDFVIRGDAEEPLLRLVAALKEQPTNPDVSGIPNLTYRSGGRVVDNALAYCASSPDLAQLNYADLDFLRHGKEYRRTQYLATGMKNTADPTAPQGQWIATGRGCRFNCSYCGGSASAQRALAGRQSLAARSAKVVAEEVARLREQGVRQVSFSLDPAIFGESYWRALFQEIAARHLRPGIYNEVFQLLPKGFIQAFVEAADLSHSQLAITPLVGSEPVRKMNGKTFSNRELMETLAELKQHKVPVIVFFSLNLPGEDQKSFQKTLELAARLIDFYPPDLLLIISQCHTLDPLSPMSVHPEQFGIGITLRTFADYYEYCQQTPQAQRAAQMGELRGFAVRGRNRQALEDMAMQWAAFCRVNGNNCLPIPYNW